MYSGVLLEFLNMGGGEIALIMVAILLLFGGKKLPELARGLGKGIREFKDASEGVKREIHRNINSVDLDEELKDEPNNERHHPTTDDEPLYPEVAEEKQQEEEPQDAPAPKAPKKIRLKKSKGTDA
jgi:sec-independent protein translocase protein TatA